jgi:hypothetical protein
MNDPLIEQAIPLVFPAEKASPELHTRVQALQPPPKAALRFPPLRFRGVVAIVVLLWIGHNIPAAVRAWNNIGYSPRGYHTTRWVHGPTKDYLQGENWSARGKSRDVTYGNWKWDTRTKTRSWAKYEHPTVVVVTERESYRFTPGDSAVPVQVMTLPKATPPSLQRRLFVTSSILFFRVRDRPVLLPHGKKIVRTSPENSLEGFVTTTTYEPETGRYLIDRKNPRGEGMLQVNEPMAAVPESYFVPDFPKGARIVTVPTPVIAPAPSVTEQAVTLWNKLLLGN